MKRWMALSLVLTFGAAIPGHAWESARLAKPVQVNDHLIPYPVFAIFVMPGSPISVGLVDATGGASLRFAGREIPFGDEQLRAPTRPGLETLEIENNVTGETCVINVFTMVPATELGNDQHLQGFRIGAYPRKPLRGLSIYLPPGGFVKVTEQNQKVKVSPNFTLGEFLSKQQSGYPKFLVLRTELLLKLENILAKLNISGYPVDSIVIMSGYRTPYYNRSIGNVPYSRHVYGGAADIYIDQAPADGRMDDLNQDGKVNRDDARWLANFITEMSRRGDFGPRIGGLGIYGSTSAHGPFVHVDVRGSVARW